MLVRPPLNQVTSSDSHWPEWKLWMTWPCSERIGSCERVWPPKKSSLSLKKVAAACISKVHAPSAFDTPISGLIVQRWPLMLTRRLSSYCPHGGETCTLAPTIRSCFQPVNSRSDSAGDPYRLTESRNAGRLKPDTARSIGSSL